MQCGLILLFVRVFFSDLNQKLTYISFIRPFLCNFSALQKVLKPVLWAFYFQITVCPPLKLKQMLKSEELEKNKLVYVRDFLGVQRDNNERVFNWKSQNGSLSPEEVQHLVKTISISMFMALDYIRWCQGYYICSIYTCWMLIPGFLENWRSPFPNRGES